MGARLPERPAMLPDDADALLPSGADSQCCEPFCSATDDPVKATHRWREKTIEYHFCRLHFLRFLDRRIGAAIKAVEESRGLLEVQYGAWFNRRLCSDQATQFAKDCMAGLNDLRRTLLEDQAIVAKQAAVEATA